VSELFVFFAVFGQRYLCVLGVILCIVLGYKLFVRGVGGPSSLLVEHRGTLKLRLNKAAPGLILMLIGVVLLGYIVCHPPKLVYFGLPLIQQCVFLGVEG
jgi:hypothetical protein